MQYESVFGDALHNVATVSFNMAAERVSTSSVVKLNLSAIKKSDQYVVNIIDNASQVALYKFNGTTQAWVSTAQLIFQFLHVWSCMSCFRLHLCDRQSFFVLSVWIDVLTKS